MSLLILNTIVALNFGLAALHCSFCQRHEAAGRATAQQTEVASQPDRNWRRLSKLRTPIYDIKVLDGRELLISGIRCRLFGIRLPDDVGVRSVAKRFLELYVSSNGGYINVHNVESPVNDRDGVPLIWLANDGNVAWAQEALVQAGLAVVDYGGFEEYRFRAPRRSFASEINWKECFRNAEASYKAGAELNIQFNWPERKPDRLWKRLAKLQAPIYGVKVLNGRELVIAGVRCRLFGIRLPDDEAAKAKAKRFLELYVHGYGGYFFIYNTESPVSDRDGVPLIWLQGSGNGGWAQQTLVQAGLAIVDYAGFEDYKFRVPGKIGFAYPEYNWKECFRDAEADRAAGKNPNISFDWPERTATSTRRNKRSQPTPR
jgi:hypothetical protein